MWRRWRSPASRLRRAAPVPSLSMTDVHGVADLPASTAPATSGRAASDVVPDYFGDDERGGAARGAPGQGRPRRARRRPARRALGRACVVHPHPGQPSARGPARAGERRRCSSSVSWPRDRHAVGDETRAGCPVPLSSLRYMQMSYRDFDGRSRTGEMVVHRRWTREQQHLGLQLPTGRGPGQLVRPRLRRGDRHQSAAEPLRPSGLDHASRLLGGVAGPAAPRSAEPQALIRAVGAVVASLTPVTPGAPRAR